MASKSNQPLKIIQNYSQHEIDFFNNQDFYKVTNNSIKNYMYVDEINCLHRIERKFHVWNHWYCLQADFSNKNIIKYIISKRLGQKSYTKACHQCSTAKFYDKTAVRNFKLNCKTTKINRLYKYIQALRKELELKNNLT